MQCVTIDSANVVRCDTVNLLDLFLPPVPCDKRRVFCSGCGKTRYEWLPDQPTKADLQRRVKCSTCSSRTIQLEPYRHRLHKVKTLEPGTQPHNRIRRNPGVFRRVALYARRDRRLSIRMKRTGRMTDAEYEAREYTIEHYMREFFGCDVNNLSVLWRDDVRRLKRQA